MNITGRTRLLALFGSPVAHSGSPAMYNYSFDELGIDYVYTAIDIKREELKQAVAAAKLYNMRGFNLTMPCKNEAINYIDKLSPAAKLAGAVNTVINDNGILTGYITDGSGFINNLKYNGIDIVGKKIIVAGGGGAATAILVQSALEGAGEVIVFSRKEGFLTRVLKVVEELKEFSKNTVINAYDINNIERFTAEIRSSDIFVNATIVGMKPMEDESIVKDTCAFRKGLVVADAVYNPEKTRLLSEAEAAGCKCIYGKGMLLWQGAEAFKLFTGMDMPVEKVRERFFS